MEITMILSLAALAALLAFILLFTAAEIRLLRRRLRDTHECLANARFNYRVAKLRLKNHPHRTKCSECNCESENCKKWECYGGDYVCFHDQEERL